VAAVQKSGVDWVLVQEDGAPDGAMKQLEALVRVRRWAAELAGGGAKRR
jgi:hypothetical protein